MPVVAPTEVKLYGHSARTLVAVGSHAYKGHPEGKVGMKVVQRWLCDPDTPPSPEAKRMEVPRAPSCMYALQSELN